VSLAKLQHDAADENCKRTVNLLFILSLMLLLLVVLLLFLQVPAAAAGCARLGEPGHAAAAAPPATPEFECVR
jgi:hypothetical protein